MNKRPPLAKTSVTVDIVVFSIQDNTLQLLLLHRTEPPFAGRSVLPGGFLWEPETTQQTAERVLHDKTGINDVFCEQLFTFDNLDRDPRGRIISVAYMALAPVEQLQTLKDDAFLLPVAQATYLGFDHDHIVSYALKRLRNKLSYSTIAYSVLPQLFTLTQLQQTYEAILGRSLDKRNFRKKIMSLDILEQTEHKTAKAAHRPALLYRFKKQVYAELDEPIF